MPDYYKILGVQKEATFDQIRSAYRIKAKIYHPDINKGADAKLKFQQLNEAYHVLVDRDKRLLYNIKMKDNITLYRKYGKNYENRHAGYYAGSSDYPSNMSSKPSDEKENIIIYKIWKHTDIVLYYTMVIIAIVILVNGIRDLLFEKWEGEKNLRGIMLGITFTALLLYGWNLKRKSKNKYESMDGDKNL
jgi:curved DNA-binding protein CbpA